MDTPQGTCFSPTNAPQTRTHIIHSVWCCRTAPRDRLFTALFRFPKSCILCSCEGGEGGHGSQAPSPWLGDWGRSEDTTLLAVMHLQALPAWHHSLLLEDTRHIQNKDLGSLDVLKDISLPAKYQRPRQATSPAPPKRSASRRQHCQFKIVIFKGGGKKKSICLILTRNSHFGDCLCCHG